MPYAPEWKRDTRERILESARRLFNRKGNSSMSIEEIMSDAGLIHGGFYRRCTVFLAPKTRAGCDGHHKMADCAKPPGRPLN
jgi:hypothetical protein